VLRWDATDSKWLLSKSGDGRIPQEISVSQNADSDGEAAWATVKITDYSGSWNTASPLKGFIWNASTGVLNPRRTGTYTGYYSACQKDNNSGTFFYEATISGLTPATYASRVGMESNASLLVSVVCGLQTVAAAGSIFPRYRSSVAGAGCTKSNFHVSEVL
jgi:hypothetical protein